MIDIEDNKKLKMRMITQSIIKKKTIKNENNHKIEN